MKFIVVTGGVLSGLGKGIVASSIAKVLQSRGYSVCPIKFDGYLNVDAGTMNPYRHGEVFVLEDGTECDMDLGNYERFLRVKTNYHNNPTGGKIFQLVLNKERKGDYLGVDVQFIPHVTGEIKKWVKSTGEKAKADIVIIEVGGTVGDIENAYFIEAMRELDLELGNDSVAFVHVTLVPSLKVVGEQKTKPTQQSVKELLRMGVQPDFVLCRTEEPLQESPRKKIALFCNVKEENVISDQDCRTIYEVPIILENEMFSEKILNRLSLPVKPLKMDKWRKAVNGILNPEKEVTVALVGKYTALHDAYVSILESLVHAGAHLKTKVNVKFIEATDIEKGKLKPEKALQGVDGIIVPIGFGSRGAEGKVQCIKYAREKKIPFLGLCFGFQMAVVEFARNVCGMTGANSTEVDPNTKYPVIDILPEQKKILKKGATMRLGSWPAKLTKGSAVHKLYGSETITERHRHRYEVNPEYIEKLEKKGLVFSGRSPDRMLMEFLELKDHPYFVATQAHPEFKSSLEVPSPPFLGFVKAVSKH